MKVRLKNIYIVMLSKRYTYRPSSLRMDSCKPYIAEMIRLSKQHMNDYVRAIYLNRVGQQIDNRLLSSIGPKMGPSITWESILDNELAIFIKCLNSTLRDDVCKIREVERG